MVKAGKLVKKAFFEVKAPLISAKMHLYGSSMEEMVGKVIKIDLTRSLRGKNLELKMKVMQEGDNLIGEPVSLNLAGTFIRKMMRKGSDYIEDSFICNCKDVKFTVKPFLITRNKVSRSVRSMLRINARKHIESYLKTRNAMEIFSNIMANKIQKELSLKLKKIYPLALCEIRTLSIMGKSEIKKPKEKEEKTEEIKENTS